MTSGFMEAHMFAATGKVIALNHYHWVQKFFVALVLGLFAIASMAEVKMEDIEFSSLPGDKVEIRMIFDSTPPSPTGYTIEQPARIALDLMGVVSGLASKYHPLGSGNARSVTVIEAGDRTRVIVAMTELVGYSARVEGNSLYVLVGQEQGLSMLASGTQGVIGTQTSPYERGVARVEEIDFRRGEAGEGRVIVKLSDDGIGIDVSSEGGKIRVEFAATRIPESLQRRLDVSIGVGCCSQSSVIDAARAGVSSRWPRSVSATATPTQPS